MNITSEPTVVGSSHTISCHLSEEKPWYVFIVYFNHIQACFWTNYSNGTCDIQYNVCHTNYTLLCDSKSFYIKRDNVGVDVNGTFMYCALWELYNDGESLIRSDEITIHVYGEHLV